MEETRRRLSVLDLSKQQPNPPSFDPPHHKLAYDRAKRATVVYARLPGSIDSIVVHQTAVPFGVTKAAVKEAGGDAKLAKHRRALGVAAHMTAFDTGVAVLAHPLEWYVYHANLLNARSLGIEVEGSFPGKQGSKELLTGPLLAAARDGLTYLVREGRARGMPIRYVWAHRQSSMTRQNDPGEEIWRKLVLEYAIPELGLMSQPEATFGGLSLPIHWLGKRVS